MSFMYKAPVLPKAAQQDPSPSSSRQPKHDSRNHDNPQASILVFPSRAPSESPASSPHIPAPEIRRGSTTVSIPSSLISSVERRSPQSSSTPSESGWDDSDSDPRPRLGCAPPPQPLTRDRLALLQNSTRIDGVWERGQDMGHPSASDDVEVWDWTETSAQHSGPSLHAQSSQLSSLLQGRRPLPTHDSLHELDSSSASDLHFITPEDSDDDFSSIFFVALNPSHRTGPPHHKNPIQKRTRNHNESHMDKHWERRRAIPPSIFNTEEDQNDSELAAVSYYSPQILRLPFESLIRFFFDLDPSTLRLLKQQNARPHPDNPFNEPPTGLFASAVSSANIIEKAASAEDYEASIVKFNRERIPSLFGDDSSASATSIKRGLDTLNQFQEAPIAPHTLLVGMARLPILLVKAVLRT